MSSKSSQITPESLILVSESTFTVSTLWLEELLVVPMLMLGDRVSSGAALGSHCAS